MQQINIYIIAQSNEEKRQGLIDNTQKLSMIISEYENQSTKTKGWFDVLFGVDESQSINYEKKIKGVRTDTENLRACVHKEEQRYISALDKLKCEKSRLDKILENSTPDVKIEINIEIGKFQKILKKYKYNYNYKDKSDMKQPIKTGLRKRNTYLL
uniref:Uncharacterized protein n=1 Tax=viral metagenome TaxID=1070528 RepID=A0A6C0J5H5_9ZZZZ